MVVCEIKRSCLLLASSRTKRYIYRAHFFIFLALAAYAGGLTYFSSSGFSDSPPSKVKVFGIPAKFMPEFLCIKSSKLNWLQEQTPEKVISRLCCWADTEKHVKI